MYRDNARRVRVRVLMLSHMQAERDRAITRKNAQQSKAN